MWLHLSLITNKNGTADRHRPNTGQAKPIQFLDHPITTVAADRPIILQTTLNEVLSDNAPRPYTAKAFADFISHRHCTELLDFIVKAQDYSDLYANLQYFFRKEEKTPESTRIEMKWKLLMRTFIFTGSPKELNLPWTARNQLLNQLGNNSDLVFSPPRPEKLNFAIRHIQETLACDVLIPFLRSYPLSSEASSKRLNSNPSTSQTVLFLNPLPR